MTSNQSAAKPQQHRTAPNICISAVNDTIESNVENGLRGTRATSLHKCQRHQDQQHRSAPALRNRRDGSAPPAFAPSTLVDAVVAHTRQEASTGEASDRAATKPDAKSAHRVAPSISIEAMALKFSKRMITLQEEHSRRAAEWEDQKRRTEAGVAAISFDTRQHSNKSSSLRALKNAASRPADERAQHAFKQHCLGLFRNRFFVPEKPPPAPARIVSKGRTQKIKPESPRAAWRLETSIWAGRQFRGGENRGFYDDDTVVRRAIVCDFRKAIGKGPLLPYMLKHDKRSPEPSDAPERLEAFAGEIEDVIVSHGRMFFMIFDYFASMSGTNDLFHIHRNAFDQLVQRCGLQVKGSKHCDLAHLDIIFVQVNATQLKPDARAAQPKTMADHDSKHTLTRAELIQCLCRIAIARYILTSKTAKTPKAGKDDVSDAIDELFKTIRNLAGREVLQDGQAFRRASCYIEDTDRALRVHEPALQVLFAKYSALGGQDSCNFKSGVADSDQLLSPGEWICMCTELGLVDADLSIDDAKLIFMWSRMRVIDEDSKNRERIENLTFWGFLEAMIRVAQSKALPTDEEVAASPYSDGGDFIIGLRRDAPADFQAFIRANDRQWWEQTRQPIAAKLQILLQVIMRTLATSLARWEADGSASKVRKELAAKSERSTKSVRVGQEVRSQSTASAKPNASLLLDGVGTCAEGLSKETMNELSSGLEQQADVLNSAAKTIQASARGNVARTRIAKVVERRRKAAEGEATVAERFGHIQT